MARSTLAVVGHIGPAPRGDRISAPHALAALAALGQPTRLDIFRLLMRREPRGLAAGAIADAIGCPHNTLSSHLSILARSGLVRGTRDGRSIIYRADIEGMRALVAFLITDCCDGHPEVCNLPDALRDGNAVRPHRKPTHAGNSPCRTQPTEDRSMFSFSARATRRARSSPRRSSVAKDGASSAPSRREAIRRAAFIPMPAISCAS